MRDPEKLKKIGVPYHFAKELSNYTLVDWLTIPKKNNFIIVRTILIFVCYGIITDGFEPVGILSSLLVSIPSGYIIALFETHSIEFRMIYRRHTFMSYLFIKTFRLAIWLSVIFNIVIGMVILFHFNIPESIFPESFSAFYPRQYFEFLGIALLEDSLANFFIELNRKLGSDVLKNLVMGKYHKAGPQERTFLFIDLKNSTGIAEDLGELKFSEFLQDFFYDISDPINNFSGQVYQYVGDEVVITWKDSEGFKDNRCINVFWAIRKKIQDYSDYYLETYGIIPEFKASLHAGTVIIAEVGKIKSEIAFHGDVVNTTSRILELCRELKHDFLITESVYKNLSVTPRLFTGLMGTFQLRGKMQEIVIYAVELFQETKIITEIDDRTIELVVSEKII